MCLPESIVRRTESAAKTATMFAYRFAESYSMHKEAVT